MTEQEKLKDKRQIRRALILICIGFAVFVFYNVTNMGSSDTSTASEPKEEIHCIVCSKDLTDDFHRIQPNGEGYFCMPCYQKAMKGIHDDMRTEGYNTSEYSEGQSYSTSDYSQESSDYSTGSDGRVYENEACSLCGGTGVETSHTATFGDQRRVCPMCEGKGHQSY